MTTEQEELNFKGSIRKFNHDHGLMVTISDDEVKEDGSKG